jgi:hypothetical protein
MINFHLGAPGLFRDLPLILAGMEASQIAAERHILSPELLDTKVRPYLNSRTKDARTLDALRRDALAAVEMVPWDIPVACSQPELFGSSAEFLLPGKTLPAAERRFRRLCEIFEGRGLTAHIVVTCQVDTIWQLEDVPREQKLHAIRETGLSWSNLVWRLRRAAPQCRMIVWDFEHPRVIAPFLVETLLEVGQGGLGGDVYRRMARYTDMPQLEFVSSCSADEALAVERLDDLYDVELEKIAKIKGVTLMRFDG